MHLHEDLDQAQAQPNAPVASGDGGVDLVEAFEHPIQLVGRDPDALVTDPEHERGSVGARSHFARARRR